jgi:hypothetical protein
MSYLWFCIPLSSAPQLLVALSSSTVKTEISVPYNFIWNLTQTPYRAFMLITLRTITSTIFICLLVAIAYNCLYDITLESWTNIKYVSIIIHFIMFSIKLKLLKSSSIGFHACIAGVDQIVSILDLTMRMTWTSTEN